MVTLEASFWLRSAFDRALREQPLLLVRAWRLPASRIVDGGLASGRFAHQGSRRLRLVLLDEIHLLRELAEPRLRSRYRSCLMFSI